MESRLMVLTTNSRLTEHLREAGRPDIELRVLNNPEEVFSEAGMALLRGWHLVAHPMAGEKVVRTAPVRTLVLAPACHSGRRPKRDGHQCEKCLDFLGKAWLEYVERRIPWLVSDGDIETVDASLVENSLEGPVLVHSR